MAFLSGRPERKPDEQAQGTQDRFLRSGIDARIDGPARRDDFFNSPAFRAHIQGAHHGRNPFQERESSLEQAAKELPRRFDDDSEKEVKREQERIMLYGNDKSKGEALYGTKDADAGAAYGSGHASSSGDHLTCCNIDFMKDGSVQQHQEEKSATYAGAPGAAGGYAGSKAGTAASLYKK